MYRTFYKQWSGDATNGNRSHETLADAVQDWLAGCESLYANDNGESVLTCGERRLVFQEGTEGAFCWGDLLENWDGVDATDRNAVAAAMLNQGA